MTKEYPIDITYLEGYFGTVVKGMTAELLLIRNARVPGMGSMVDSFINYIESLNKYVDLENLVEFVTQLEVAIDSSIDLIAGEVLSLRYKNLSKMKEHIYLVIEVEYIEL